MRQGTPIGRILRKHPRIGQTGLARGVAEQKLSPDLSVSIEHKEFHGHDRAGERMAQRVHSATEDGQTRALRREYGTKGVELLGLQLSNPPPPQVAPRR